MDLYWEDAEEIAERLLEQHPDQDALRIRFTDLRQWVLDLPEFKGDPQASSEGVLEGIMMAWHELKEEG